MLILPRHLQSGFNIVDNDIAQKVLARAKGFCEACGFSGELVLHHRKLRSQGGQDAVSNLIAIHSKCHNMGTKSIHNQPKAAKEKGFIVPSWEKPEHTVLHLYGSKPVRLDEEGNYIYLEG